MCDYSLTGVKSRKAEVGDKLISSNFGTGTGGFAAIGDKEVAICVLPGTELAFDAKVRAGGPCWYGMKEYQLGDQRVAIFRQINKDRIAAHHDALEFPDGQIVLLHLLHLGQRATVLQLPAAPKTEQEEKDQQRLEAVG